MLIIYQTLLQTEDSIDQCVVLDTHVLIMSDRKVIIGLVQHVHVTVDVYIEYDARTNPQATVGELSIE